jgi:hypothetical protein
MPRSGNRLSDGIMLEFDEGRIRLSGSEIISTVQNPE